VQPVSAEPVGPASAAPPGVRHQSGHLSSCRMEASPYPAYGPAGERGTRSPGKRSAAGRSTSERVPVF
ncbi:hypothetical protein QIH44_26640, partial [Klebsiella pneumoniae]|nr:hypothetical protein [Klebsiella pneumoniae]